jgi:hypothetical protein
MRGQYILNSQKCHKMYCIIRLLVGWDSFVCIATHYRLDSLRIKCWWGLDSLHSSRLALGPAQPPIEGVVCYSWVESSQGVVSTTLPHLTLTLKKGYSNTSTPYLCLHGMLYGDYIFWLQKFHMWICLLKIDALSTNGECYYFQDSFQFILYMACMFLWKFAVLR